ncbi:MAG: rod shape-determining protein MreD [Gemmatimonadota bacterium]
MTRSLGFWGVAFLLPILHFLLHVGLGLGAWAPDLLTVAVLVIAREVRSGVAAGTGFGLGLLADAFSVLSFGANALALTVVGILGARSRDLFVGESVLFLTFYLVLGVWLRWVIRWLASGGRLGEGAARVLLMEAPVAAFYSAAVGTVILLMTGAWRREPVR